MKQGYDVVVVGGGMAGLTAAAYLSRSGYRTLLCEKGDKTGGLATTFRRQGYLFDAGIRAFENSGILFPMLKSLSLELDFLENPVSVGIGDRWTSMSGPDYLDDYAAMLTEVFPESAAEIPAIVQEIKQVITYLDVLYGIDNPLFLDTYDGRYLMKTLLPWLLKYQINIRKAERLGEPVRQFLNRLTDNNALIDMIAQHFFQNTPAFFALSYYGLYPDYCYPKGGTGVLAQTLTADIRQNGGDIRTRTTIRGVDTIKHEIETDAGERLEYKKLVWAADQTWLYASVRSDVPSAAAGQRELTEKSKSGDSVFSVFLGVDRDPDYFARQCGAHAFYTPESTGLSSLPPWTSTAGSEQSLLDWTQAYLRRTSYEISCPVLRDASLAPPGKTGVIVSTLMDYGLFRHFADAGRYDMFKDYCAQQVIEVLDGTAFEDIRADIEFSAAATPLTIENETGNTGGAITGWAFTNKPMPAENRFRQIARSVETTLPDVYQCGQWTFSPSGLPISILTGKLAADAASKALRKEKKTQ